MGLFKAIGKFCDKMVHAFDHMHEKEPEVRTSVMQEALALRAHNDTLEEAIKAVDDCLPFYAKSYEDYEAEDDASFREELEVTMKIKMEQMEIAAKLARAEAEAEAERTRPIPIEERPETYGGW